MPEIYITNEAKVRLNIRKLRIAIEYILIKAKRNNFDISVVITGDRTIKKWNKLYRKKDGPTDILSFSGEGNFLGEILINYTEVKRQAGQFSQTAYEEFIFILIHGILHLIGHNDETERKKSAMISLGKKYFNELKKAKLL
jgi:probable rRNA maturation factor